MIDSIFSDTKLSYFKVESYEYESSYTFDASCSPRPSFCMGLLLRGKAHFKDSTPLGGEFELVPGEIVFVPCGTRYVANWLAQPDVFYITIHFLFDFPASLARGNRFRLQKLSFDKSNGETAQIEKLYREILCNFNGGEAQQFGCLARFYHIISTILPRLEVSVGGAVDSRIVSSVEYIENNYRNQISVERLALEANMSLSRFFPFFKSQMGVTPVDYINHFRVSKAVSLLVNERELSIEQISDRVGFESSAYFRRVFKKITGRKPKDYRGISAEV